MGGDPVRKVFKGNIYGKEEGIGSCGPCIILVFVEVRSIRRIESNLGSYGIAFV